MKTFLLIILIFGQLSAFSQIKKGKELEKSEEIKRSKILEKSKEHFASRDYFTALDLIASSYKYTTPDQNVQYYIEQLVAETGTHYFNTYNDLELRKMNIPTTDLIMAKRNLYLNKYKYTHERLKRMPKGHRLYPEALLTKGTAYYMNQEYDKAIKSYNNCSETAYGWEKLTNEKQKRYFAVLKETCIINVARIYYKQGNYKQAIRNYQAIPKASFKWPYTLIERAWAHYYLGNYNRSLGIIMTYNSPLLESYFTPEAEILKALNYYKLCLYEDALKVIDNYYNTYAPKSDQLKSLINKMNKEDLAFFNLMFTPIEESEKKNRFIRNLVTQMTKRIKYNLDLNSYYAMNEEILRASKDANQPLLKRMQRDLKEQINHYVKVSMYDFINEIHSLSSEMFNLKLEILSKKRDLAYKNKTFDKNRKRGNFKNIERQADEEFWTFKNAFWADELGDYSFALSSTCKTKRIKVRD